MGSKFFINYLRQKWCQINDLYVAVALYWVCRYRLPSAVVDYKNDRQNELSAVMWQMQVM